MCDKPAPFTELIIDGSVHSKECDHMLFNCLLYRLFQEILESTSSTDIEFYQNGTWEPIMETEGTYHYCDLPPNHILLVQQITKDQKS